MANDLPLNTEFYRRISDGLDIQGFDANKWSKATREYSNATRRFCDRYKYYNNPLEESAYTLQSKINKVLGLPVETSRDAFPKNYSSMIDSLKRQGITDVLEQEKIIQETLQYSQLKYIDTKLLDLYRKRLVGVELTSDELMFVERVYLDFGKTNIKKQVSVTQKASQDAESYINQGLFTARDIIRSLT